MVRRENQMWTLHTGRDQGDPGTTTGSGHRIKPGVAEERRNVITYLQEVFPSVLKGGWKCLCDKPGPMQKMMLICWFRPLLCPEFDSVPGVGGDRDGHPLGDGGSDTRDVSGIALGQPSR